MRLFAISLLTNCAKSGGGSIGASRHGSAETCSFAPSPTASRSFAMAGSARRTQPQTRRAGAGAGLRCGDSHRGRPEDQSGRAAGARMERPHAYGHGGGGRLYLRRTELPLADRDRPRHHWSPLVRPALLRTSPEEGHFRCLGEPRSAQRRAAASCAAPIYTRKSY